MIMVPEHSAAFQDLASIQQTILECENCFLQLYLLAHFNAHYLSWIDQVNPCLNQEFLARKSIFERTLKQQLRCLVPHSNQNQRIRRTKNKPDNQGDQRAPETQPPTIEQSSQHRHRNRETDSLSQAESEQIFQLSVKLARLFGRVVTVQVDYIQPDNNDPDQDQVVSMQISIHNNQRGKQNNKTKQQNVKLNKHKTQATVELPIAVEFNSRANLFSIQIEIEQNQDSGEQTKRRPTMYRIEETEISGYSGYRFHHRMGTGKQKPAIEFSFEWNIGLDNYRPLPDGSGLLIGARLFIQRLPILLGRIDNHYWKFLAPLVKACVSQREDPLLALGVIAAGPQIALILDSDNVKTELIPLLLDYSRGECGLALMAQSSSSSVPLVDQLLRNLFALHSSMSTVQLCELLEWLETLLESPDQCPVSDSLIQPAIMLAQVYHHQIGNHRKQTLLDALGQVIEHRAADTTKNKKEEEDPVSRYLRKLIQANLNQN